MNSENSVKTILILAANPRNTTPLRLDEEVREIDAGLYRASKREQFDLKQKWAVRPRDVRRALLDVKPQIVHFCGHGVKNGGLALENDQGEVKLVDPEALAELFELFADHIECVLLNSCYSEIQADAIARHINYVIGMRHAIEDKAAIEFSVGFYDALGVGQPIEFAYKLACNAIRMEGISEYLNPILKKKHIFTSSQNEYFSKPLGFSNSQEQKQQITSQVKPQKQHKPSTSQGIGFGFSEEQQEQLNLKQTRFEVPLPDLLKSLPEILKLHNLPSKPTSASLGKISVPSSDLTLTWDRQNWSSYKGFTGSYNNFAFRPPHPIRSVPSPQTKNLDCFLEEVDSSKLEKLLAAGRWREADAETETLVLKLAHREEEGFLRNEDILELPGKNLRIIDQLWLHYSSGRFSFCVQNKIWQSIEERMFMDENSLGAYYANFGEIVGWRIKNKWLHHSELNFNIAAPMGHLPVGGIFLRKPIGFTVDTAHHPLASNGDYALIWFSYLQACGI